MRLYREISIMQLAKYIYGDNNQYIIDQDKETKTIVNTFVYLIRQNLLRKKGLNQEKLTCNDARVYFI
jgi:hypothetical protein